MQRRVQFEGAENSGAKQKDVSMEDDKKGDLKKVVALYSINRIKKNLNNYILNNAEVLLLKFNSNTSEHEKKYFSIEDIYENKVLLQKATEELRLCEGNF